MLNLPQKISINNGGAQGTNEYTYSASGVKLRMKSHSDMKRMGMPVHGTSIALSDNIVGKVVDYIGNKVYEDDKLKMILLDNGYYDNLENKYYFYVRDHLGNNRIVVDAGGAVTQSNEYYPFGMTFANQNSKGGQPYKYNGKELDEMNDLNQYDYSARYYDPAEIRFTSIDPLAEINYSWSPYIYVDNNPINFIDPDGMKKGDLDDPVELPEVVVKETTEENSYLDYTRSFFIGQWSNILDIVQGSSIRSNYYNPMNDYIRNNATNSAEYAMSRYHIAQSARAQMGPISKSISELQKSKSDQNATAKYFASRNLSTSATTRMSTNVIANGTIYIGRVFVVTTTGISVYNITTSENIPKATVTEIGGWAGAWMGAKGIGVVGAKIGTAVAGPTGTAIGTIVGGGVGGGVGYWSGSETFESIYEIFE